MSRERSITTTSPRSGALGGHDAASWPTGRICAILIALVFVVYFPALKAGFIWDDEGHVTRADLRSLEGLGRIWFEKGATQQYYPFLHSAFWLEHLVWGDSPLGYHLVNIVLHATGACLFYVALFRLRVPGAAFGAVLFAVHPIGVESVAWIAEQKNTLSTVLYLCAALSYLRFAEERRTAKYVLGTAFFVLALLTKSVTATLPAALLVLLWWRSGKLSWRRDVIPLLPWFVLGIVAGFVTAASERQYIGAQGADFGLSAIERCLLAGRIVCFYFGKIVWPYPLVFMYPRWEVDGGALWQYFFPIAVAAVLLTAFLWRRVGRGSLAVLLLFIGTLVPALGFVNVYPFVYSFVADHFQYLASLSLFAWAGAGLYLVSKSWPAFGRYVLAGLALVLGVLTWRQNLKYENLFTLYQSILEDNPTSWMVHQNLAIALVEAGRGPEAIEHFEAALKLRPNYPEAENSYGDLLNRLRRPKEALEHLDRALAARPEFAEAHSNRGATYMALGKTREGIAEFQEAVRLKPALAVAHFNLGLALASNGNPRDAIEQFQTAVRLQPNYAEAELDWAVALTLTDRLSDAGPHYRRALELAPENARAHVLYGQALAKGGHPGEAIVQFEAALQLGPNLAETHMQMALALRQLGRMAEATEHYQIAQRLGGAR